jgi:integrase/recombinase XerC
VTRDHVSDVFTDLINTRSASTASVRYRARQQLFNWLVAEEEIDASPMAKMTPPPLVPEKPVPVLTDDHLRALLASCKGRGFRDRRDLAIIRLFADTGLRLDELAIIRVEDADLDDQVAVVLGKGRRPRAVPFGVKTTQAVDRYIRARAHHSRASEPPVWLGDNNKQAMTPTASARRSTAAASGRHRRPPLAHAPPHLRPHLAQRGRQRGATSCAS